MHYQRRTLFGSITVAVALLLPPAVLAQVRADREAARPAASSASSWTAPRTSWGHPDLQGVWSTATITPLERPAELAGTAFFTEQEAREYERQVVERSNRDRRDGGATADVARAYNDFWWDTGTRVVPSRRTSLIIDPPDGRVPPLTAAAEKRLNDLAEARKQRGPADHPEDRNLWERCITRGLPNVMLPQPYNNNYQVLQTRDYVVIVAEMIHDARIIPLDGRAHLPSHLREWMGDPVGRWEGDTLVVETTNFTNKTSYRGAGENLRLVERFTRTAPGVLRYQATIDDPTTFTRPWTIELPATPSDGEIYEYACHEGNYAMFNILNISRAMEKAGRK
jgi:hypothetical protein